MPNRMLTSLWVDQLVAMHKYCSWVGSIIFIIRNYQQIASCVDFR